MIVIVVTVKYMARFSLILRPLSSSHMAWGQGYYDPAVYSMPSRYSYQVVYSGTLVALCFIAKILLVVP